MGKRCEEIKCPYLAMDGTCLLSENGIADKGLIDKCPARETVLRESKDEWMENV